MYSFKKISILALSCLFVVALSYTSSQAQVRDSTKHEMMSKTYTFSGTVVNARTSDAVSDAHIWIKSKGHHKKMMDQDSTMHNRGREMDKDHDMMSKNKTMTDEDGEFEMEDVPAGTHMVIVKADGYRTWKKEMKLNDDMDNFTIKLKPKG